VVGDGRKAAGAADRQDAQRCAFELHLLRCGLQEGTVSTVVGKIEAMQCCPSRPLCHLRHNTVSCGDPGIDAGVIGKIEDGSDGELALECSYECEYDRGGVWQYCRQYLFRPYPYRHNDKVWEDNGCSDGNGRLKLRKNNYSWTLGMG